MENSRFGRMKVPDLPDNKDFHVFVSYTGENAEQVRKIVKNLEENGIKCCYHERDFKPGESVMGNMNDGMKRSLAMLIVLTEEFYYSKYCSFELDEALHMKISDDYFLVPIKLEPCVVPDCLRNITYIDAEDEEIDRVHLKIIKAFVDREIKKDQQAKNGQTMEFPVKPYKKNKISMTRYKLEIDPEDRLKLKDDEFELSDQILNEAETIVNKSSLVKYKHLTCRSSICGVIINVAFILLQGLIICFLSVWLTTSSDTLKNTITPAELVLAIGSSVLLVVISVILILAAGWIFDQYYEERLYPNTHIVKFIIQERRQLNNKLWDNVSTNSDNKQSLFVFFFMDTLNVMRFNLNPCKELFLRKLERKQHLLKYMKRNESFEDYTERIFKVFLRNHIHMLKVEAGYNSKSHKLATEGECVCLLVEEWIGDQ